MPRRGRNRRRRRNAGNAYTEIFTFALTIGTTTNVTVANLSQRMANANFRVMWMEVTATSFGLGYANSGTPGFYIPALMQVDLCDPSSLFAATSNPRLIKANGTRVRVAYPRSADWFSYATAKSAVLAKISAICLGSSQSGGGHWDSVVQGMVKIRVHQGPEQLEDSCPSYSHLGNMPAPPQCQLSWAEEVDLEIPLNPSRQEERVDVRRRPSRLTESDSSVVIDLSFLDDAACHNG